MAKNNIYVLDMNDKLAENFQKLKARFRKDERIVHQSTDGNKLIVTTEYTQSKPGLLFDGLQR